MTMQLRCRCGAVRGEMDPGRAYVRVTCYCKDCRAFARFVGDPSALDASGGSDIVAMAPAAVRFTAGIEHVACMSLSPKGLLRWYTSCCRTPLANTPRDPSVRYVGMATTCFDAEPQAVDAALNKVSTQILENHLNSCVITAINGDDPQERAKVIKEITEVFEMSAKV